MKIVIDIDEKLRGRIFHSDTIYDDDKADIVKAIVNGTPLPEHHGDLIDRRELKKEVYTTTEWNGDIHRIIYEASIDDAKPIIEAEGSDSE